MRPSSSSLKALSAVVGGALLLGAAGLHAPRQALAAFKFLKPGMQAADFTVVTLDDREITLAQLKAGGPAALIVFWATWSPRSEAALREAQGLRERFAANGLQVLAVNVDRQDVGLRERALIEKAAADWGITLPVAIDPGLAACSCFGVVANPSFALLDGNGVLVYEASGWSKSTAAALRAQVEILLSLAPAPQAPVAAAQPRRPEHKALLYFNLARNLMRQGERAKAIDVFSTAAEADPSWAPPRTVLGHILLQQGTEASLQGAEKRFREAVALEPADVSAMCGLGEALLRTGRLEEASSVLERAHALDASFTPAVTGRAIALARLGKEKEALELFDAALALNPRDAAVYAGRAECREIAGKHREGAADYRQAVELLLGAR